MHDLRYNRGDYDVLYRAAVKIVLAEKLRREQTDFIGSDIVVSPKPKRSDDIRTFKQTKFNVGVADIDCKQHYVTSRKLDSCNQYKTRPAVRQQKTENL